MGPAYFESVGAGRGLVGRSWEAASKQDSWVQWAEVPCVEVGDLKQDWNGMLKNTNANSYGRRRITND